MSLLGAPNYWIGRRGKWHRASEAASLDTFRRCSSGWASTARRGVNWSVTLASCSARWRDDLSKSMRCAAIGRSGVTIFAAELENCSHRAEAVAKGFVFTCGKSLSLRRYRHPPRDYLTGSAVASCGGNLLQSPSTSKGYCIGGRASAFLVG